MSKKSLWFAVSALLVMSMILAACASPEEPAEATEAPAAEVTEEVVEPPSGEPSGELEIYSWWAGDEGPALEARVDPEQKPKQC